MTYWEIKEKRDNGRTGGNGESRKSKRKGKISQHEEK